MATRSKFARRAFAFEALMRRKAISFAVAMTALSIGAEPRPRMTWTRSSIKGQSIACLSTLISTGAQLPCVRWTALHAGYFCVVSMTLNIFELGLPMQTGR
jgi:hypothetical protein